ncbi:CheR family methyltransferase [Nannocystis pusilla]|uniref:Protein-glutamate O-methyltransferase CheR n=1 Tax=Nannocystis pusilla TaxID=889268 RepID=A0ABS7TLW6_9BACT|nr:CheR family methyltransferase [Nannocystis pusilla]MBZ5709209.1 protein-glutamate O-methyltransferase CheR [Nannocystis pusilla]
MTGSDESDPALSELLEAVYHRYHYDFRGYAEASLRRRVAAAVGQLRCAGLAELRERVLAEPRMFSELLRYLTVQVSDLFRDPTYFRAIRERVVPYLRTYPSLKIWVAGCATGEEAYSLAIILAEEGLLARTLIYATDIHPESLRIAEAGVYGLDRFAKFSESYRLAGGRASLSDYYVAQYSSAILDRKLRQAILFSDHSLATDVAFAEVELVSCRNVLIYFDRPLQDRALGVLRDSVRRKGFLGLGAKETLRFSAHAQAFTELVPEDRIYQRR